jgi:apolipoprotein N-acyltransferase
MRALICAILGGAMFYLSQGLDDVWWLAWFAAAPLLWLAYRPIARRRLFGAAFLANACGQIYMVQTYGSVLPVPAMAMMVFGWAALFATAILFAQASWLRLPPAATLVAFPAAWTAIEYGVSLISPHGSWGALGYSQVSFPAAIQIASLFGLYAVTFMLCVFANALAMALCNAWRTASLGFALCGAALAFGILRLMQPAADTIKVAALSDWEGRLEATRTLALDNTRAMAGHYASAVQAEAERGARFIVIPETALAADPAWRHRALAPLAHAARQGQISITAGVILVKPWRNTAVTWLPDGSIHTYDKRHLLIPGEDKFTPGSNPGLLGKGHAVAICKDLDFPRTLRSDAAHGIRLMGVPANDFVKDGWIHARMAVMRGVENGFAVVRAAFNGLLTVSDAQGRILAEASTGAHGMTAIDSVVPLGPGPTLYTRIGDMFAWLCVGLTFGLAAILLRNRSV